VVAAEEGQGRIGYRWREGYLKRKVSVERYPEAIAIAVMGNVEAREPHRQPQLSLGAVQQGKTLVFDRGPSRSRVSAVEPPGSVPNKAVDLTVHAVTVRAGARPAPAGPAGHGRR